MSDDLRFAKIPEAAGLFLRSPDLILGESDGLFYQVEVFGLN